MSQDDLPQPYRMLVKIIELDILDTAWLEITRLHPELLLDSDGEPLSLRPNYALKNVCTPASVLEQPFLSTSLVEAQGFLFMTTSSDALVLVDPASGGILQSLLIKQQVATVPIVKASPLWIACCSAPMTTDRVLRLCLCNVVEEEEALKEPEDAGKKAPPPKKGAVAEPPPPAKKVGKCRVSIVEVRLGSVETYKSPTLVKMQLVLEAFIPLPNPSKSDVKSLDMSLDTELLCVATPRGCHLFSLPALEERDAKSSVISMENITEDVAEDAEGEEVDDAPAVLLEPFLILDTDAAFAGKVVKFASLVPLIAATSGAKKSQPPQPPTSGPASRSAAKSVASPFYKTALAVMFEEKTAEWVLLGLKGDSRDILHSTTAEVKTTVTTAELSAWCLAAGVSVMALDEGRTLLILGFFDGSLSMWNLATRTFVAVQGRHETAVTSICISRTESSLEKGVYNYYLLTGASDGSLCFFTINLPRGVNNNANAFYALSMSVDNAAPVCLSASFLAFRLDVDSGVSIANIRSLRNLPIAVVQCSDGLSCLYDLQSCKLLGKLMLYSGIMSKQIKWRVATQSELLRASLAVDADADALVVDANEGVEVASSLSSPSKPSQPESAGTDAGSSSLGLTLKRAPKYNVTSSGSVSGVDLDSVATSSHFGYHAIYFRDEAPVLASFRLEEILPTLLPGLASVWVQQGGGDGSRMAHLFNTLSPAERLDSTLANSRATAVSRLEADDFAEKAKSFSRGGSAAKPPGSSSVDKQRRGSDSSAQRQQQRRGSETNRIHRNSKTGGPSLGLTGPGAMPGAAKMSNDDDALSRDAWERIVEPGAVATRSCVKSNADRTTRKSRLNNQLIEISSSF